MPLFTSFRAARGKRSQH